MSYYPSEKAQKRLYSLFVYVSPVFSLAIILFYPNYHQITDFHLWYLFPVWIILSHILCSISYSITGISLKRGMLFFINSLAVYGKYGLFIHFRVAFLTSLFEEIIFRYFLLFYLKDLLQSPIWALFLTSFLFAAYHFHLGLNTKNLLKYIDLFIFSSIISAANIITNSFYPAFIFHGMRNYILRSLMVSKKEYEELKSIKS